MKITFRFVMPERRGLRNAALFRLQNVWQNHTDEIWQRSVFGLCTGDEFFVNVGRNGYSYLLSFPHRIFSLFDSDLTFWKNGNPRYFTDAGADSFTDGLFID